MTSTILGLAVILCGCARRNQVRLDEMVDPRTTIVSLVPIGSSFDGVQAKMTGVGFVCIRTGAILRCDGEVKKKTHWVNVFTGSWWKWNVELMEEAGKLKEVRVDHPGVLF